MFAFLSEKRMILTTRLHFLFHSYLNVYIEDSKSGHPILGKPLPSIIQYNNLVGHHITIDKVFRDEFKVGCLFEKYEGRERPTVLRSQNLFVSDFD